MSEWGNDSGSRSRYRGIQFQRVLDGSRERVEVWSFRDFPVGIIIKVVVVVGESNRDEGKVEALVRVSQQGGPEIVVKILL